jgi:hypothetical protein
MKPIARPTDRAYTAFKVADNPSAETPLIT